jgi:hypothetical protein
MLHVWDRTVVVVHKVYSGRDLRPVSARCSRMLWRRYDFMVCWSIDHLCRSVLHVGVFLAELDASATYCAGRDRR